MGECREAPDQRANARHLQKSTSYPSPPRQPTAGRESIFGECRSWPLRHLSTKFDRYDVRVHSGGCWNRQRQRRAASGRGLGPATPTAGMCPSSLAAARAAATIKARAWGEYITAYWVHSHGRGIPVSRDTYCTYREKCKVTEACRL